MTYQIREASRDDLPVLTRLMTLLGGHEVTFNDMDNRLHFVAGSPFDTLYVYEEEGAVLGLLGFRIRENLEEVSKFGEVSAIIVDPAQRRKGIGQRLMEYAEQVAAERGCIGTWLVSGFGPEEEAHQFYKDLGYTINGYRFVKRPQGDAH